MKKKNYLLATIYNAYITEFQGNHFTQQKVTGIGTSVHNIQLKQEEFTQNQDRNSERYYVKRSQIH